MYKKLQIISHCIVLDTIQDYGDFWSTKLILYLIKHAHYLLNHQGKIVPNGPLNKTEATSAHKFTKSIHLLKVN